MHKGYLARTFAWYVGLVWISFYVSEVEYAQELQNWGYQAHFSPRKFGISATFIRENPKKYRDYIAPAFVDFFEDREDM